VIRYSSLLPLLASVLACESHPAPRANPEATAASPPGSGAPRARSATPPVVHPAPGGTPFAPTAPAKVARRCGWVDNPTPANWWLVDRDGEWEISVQGGYEAAGEMPDFGANWVETNGHHGYGCACMDLTVDEAGSRVIAYRQVTVLPIDRCQKDERLPRR